MVRYSLNFVSWKLRKTVAADLRTVYTAATAEEADRRLVEFETKWGGGLSVDRAVLAAQLGAGHPVLRLSGGNSQSDLYDERDGVA